MSYNYNFNPQAVAQQGNQGVAMLPQQNVQPLFPQPQGNVYNINSTLEVANVPVGAGISIALCLPENIMYIKTMQNGNPLFYPYKILPFNQESPQNKEVQKDQLSSYNERLEKLEKDFEKLVKEKGDEWKI